VVTTTQQACGVSDLRGLTLCDPMGLSTCGLRTPSFQVAQGTWCSFLKGKVEFWLFASQRPTAVSTPSCKHGDFSLHREPGGNHGVVFPKASEHTVRHKVQSECTKKSCGHSYTHVQYTSLITVARQLQMHSDRLGQENSAHLGS
jgi:hypothetical protein